MADSPPLRTSRPGAPPLERRTVTAPRTHGARTRRLLRFARTLVPIVLLAAAGAGGTAESTTPDPTTPDPTVAPPYLDATLAPHERAADLLARMTLEEKVGQMTQVNVTRLMGSGEWDRGPLDDRWVDHVLADLAVGSLLSGGGAAPVPNDPVAWARFTNELQRRAIASSAHGIPLVYGVDAVHGHNNVLGATIYPHNIGLAASRDSDLVERIAAATARDVRATGIHWNFAPVADVGRDPRWGRTYETFGEDPVLAGVLAAAAVRGLQGDDLTRNVAATAKHFVAYGAPRAGRDRADATVTERELRDVHLVPFQAALDAGAVTVMVNSGSVNAVPAHASRYLLTDLLRDELGFDGVVVSDWHDIDKLVDAHASHADFPSAVEASIAAGVDMYMVPHDAERYVTTLVRLVREDRVPEARIDEAALRILELKFRLGLFEEPFVDERAAGAIVETERALALEAAERSLVLLENRAILPLFEDDVVAVTGPGADSLAMQMGGWTIGWQGLLERPLEIPPGDTILEALLERGGDMVRELRPGEAPDAGSVVVYVYGEEPYAEGDGDSDVLELPAADDARIRDLRASGANVVLVILSGRPVVLAPDLPIDAALMAFLPGSEGGRAVARALYGDAAPSGRLPFTWPRATGQLPFTYDEPPSEAARAPRYAFGHGLGYDDVRSSGLAATLHGDHVEIDVTLANPLDRAVPHVIDVYVRRPANGVKTAPLALAAFDAARLEPRETRSLRLRVPLERLALTTGDVFGSERAVLPGRYVFRVGRMEATLELPAGLPARRE